MRSRQILQLAVLCGVAVAIAGCDTLRSAAGSGKDSPDEFAVVTKAPLVIPPDFNLRPPAAGAAPTNQLEPTQAAQAALFPTDPNAAATPGTVSAGEHALLTSAGVQNADPAIRQEIASDANATRAADDSFTNSLLFGSSTPSGTAPLDADAEARRIDAEKAAGTAATPPATTTPAPPPPAEHKGGWLSDLFDW